MVSSGPSSIEIQPTYDRKLIAASVSKIRGIRDDAGGDVQDCSRRRRARATSASARRWRSTAAYNILGELEQVQNKRKAVLYISTGYDFDPFAEARQGRDRIQGGRFSEPTRFLLDEENPYFRLPAVNADIDLYRYMRELTLSANRANATIFTIDPRGLAGIVDAGQYLDQSEWRTYLQKTQSSLRYIAEETGGFADRQRQRLRDAPSSGSMRRPATTTSSATTRAIPTPPSACGSSKSKSIARTSPSRRGARIR